MNVFTRDIIFAEDTVLNKESKEVNYIEFGIRRF